jgi:hypothetical protein
MRWVVIILILVLLTTAVAMGQSLQDQKACYVQAHKIASKDPNVTVSNHFDAHTQTCWVKEFMTYKVTTNPVDSWYVGESIYNAFEPSVSEAGFYGLRPTPKRVVCFVHDTTCSNIAEFEKLAKQRYGF